MLERSSPEPAYLIAMRLLVPILTLVSPTIMFGAESEALRDLKGVWKADFNHDGSRIIARTRKGEVSIWNGKDGSKIDQVPEKGNYVLDPALRLAFVASNDGGGRVYAVETGKPVSPRIDAPAGVQWEPPNHFSPDSKQLLILDPEGSYLVFDVATRLKIATLEVPLGGEDADNSPSVAFAAAGGVAFVLDGRGVLRRYDTADWKRHGKPLVHPAKESSTWFGFAIDGAGKYAATFDGPGENGPNGSLQFWDVAKSAKIGEPIEARNGMGGRFLDSRRFLLRPAWDKTRIVFVPSLEELYVLPEHDDVMSSSAVVAPNGLHLYSWGHDRYVWKIHALTGNKAELFTTRAQVEDVFMAKGDSKKLWLKLDNTAFHEPGGYDNYIVRLETKRMRKAALLRILNYIHRTQLSPDGKKLMVLEGGTGKERVRVFDSLSLRELPTTAAD